MWTRAILDNATAADAVGEVREASSIDTTGHVVNAESAELGVNTDFVFTTASSIELPSGGIINTDGTLVTRTVRTEKAARTNTNGEAIGTSRIGITSASVVEAEGAELAVHADRSGSCATNGNAIDIFFHIADLSGSGSRDKGEKDGTKEHHDRLLA